MGNQRMRPDAAEQAIVNTFRTRGNQWMTWDQLADATKLLNIALAILLGDLIRAGVVEYRRSEQRQRPGHYRLTERWA